MQPELKNEKKMRESLAQLGLSIAKIERAIETWRNRPHPSQKTPHPLKGKKHPRMLAK
jgi:hypothetical protein